MGEPYFFKFFFFGNSWSNRTSECARKTGFLTFIQQVWWFLRKKFRSCIRYLLYHRKGYIHFCRPTPHSLKNSHAPSSPTPSPQKNKKIIFLLFWKITVFLFLFFVFFGKNCIKNIQNLNSYKKVYIDFWRQTPFPSIVSSHKWVFTFFLT